MARLPLVTIIGRPNTGKSSLFNRIVGKRVAIENEVAGTTRDHVTSIVETEKLDYLLVDTGGMGGGTKDTDFEDDVHAQSLLALKAADLILFVVDGQTEPLKNDFLVAEVLRKQRRRHVPIVLIINKCDNDKMAEDARPNYSKLEIDDEVITISAAHKRGVLEVEDLIKRHLEAMHFGKRERAQMSDIPRLAIIGKPNVGKSSIVNALMSDSVRSTSPRLVSTIPGTTRDATDTLVRHEDQDFILVDTAGIRRKTRVEYGVESLSMLRSIQAIEDADVTVLVLDATEPISHQDQRICGMAIDAGKSIIILLNKIDQVKSEARKMKQLEIQAELPFCRYAPVIPCSALTRDGLLKLFPMALSVKRNRERRLNDKELRRFFDDAVSAQPMSALQITKHITQADDLPPTFVLFLKRPKAVQPSQLRYLENRLRETFGFTGTPVRFVLRGPRDRGSRKKK